MNSFISHETNHNINVIKQEMVAYRIRQTYVGEITMYWWH